MRIVLGRLMVLLMLAGLTPACGGGSGGGGGAPPIVLLSDDFSTSSLSNWTADGKTVLNSGSGNPAPSAGATGGTTVATFSFASGLTVRWDFYNPPAFPSGAIMFGGLNSGTPAAPAYGAGIGIGSAGNIKWTCYLNGGIVYQDAVLQPGQPSWSTLQVSILPDQTAKYFINGSLLYHSTTTVTFSGPRDLLMGSSSGGIQFDNVVVTVP